MEFNAQQFPKDNLFKTILQPVIDKHSQSKKMTNSMSEYALTRLIGFEKNNGKYTTQMNKTQERVYKIMFDHVG